MSTIPLEDSFSDVIGKAQRGLRISDADLATKSGVPAEDLARLKSGTFDEALARKVAPHLNLASEALVALGKRAYMPQEHSFPGLAAFNTPYEDMTVNSYLVYDAGARQAAVFDTGADAGGILQFAKQNHLDIRAIFLTHVHVDHVADLESLKQESGAQAHVSELEPIHGAVPFKTGKQFNVGSLRIDTRQTSGHARGGITYVVSGLPRPLAIVGDAVFAGSMGGGLVSYEDALETNRRNIFSLPDETIICPGHGPLTSVAEEKRNNPFYPEFKT